MPSPHVTSKCALSLLALACASTAVVDPPLQSAVSLREEGFALIARDDDASLDRAAELLAEAARADPRLFQARADRALVELLVAAARRDEAARLQPSEGDALMRSGRELREQALDELRTLVRDHPADPAVARALAVYYGLEGEPEQVGRLVAQARAPGTSDPWLDFARLAAELRNDGREAAGREAALQRLATFVGAHPDLLRARVLLARARIDGGRAEDAIQDLDEILGANPRHDLAQRLKARILSPPPARVAAVPVPGDGPPPQPAGLLPRRSSRAASAAGAESTDPRPESRPPPAAPAR